MYEEFLRATGDGVFSRLVDCISDRRALFNGVMLRLMLVLRVGDSVDMDNDSIPFCADDDFKKRCALGDRLISDSIPFCDDDFKKRCALGDRLNSDSAKSCVCFMTTVRSGL